MSVTRPPSSSRDAGLTLVELLVVVIMMGLIATVLAAAFTAIVRTTPDSEARIDDANTAQGLTTYLPEDVNSTPSSGFSFASSDGSGCDGAADPGVSLLKLSWSELAVSYTANYRYEPDSDSTGFRIARYYCVDGGTADRVGLTSDLPEIDVATWTAGTYPVEVTPVPDASEPVGVTFKVATIAGEEVVIEARTNNPAVTLPPAPSGGGSGGGPGTNTPPVASHVSATIAATGSTSIALDIADADFDPITATYSNVVSATGSWTILITDLDALITPPLGATNGDSMTFEFVGNDGEEDSNVAVATVTIGVPNNPPVASDHSETIDEFTNTSVVVPISDADGDSLSVSLVSLDPSLSVVVESISAGAVVFDVLSNGSATAPTFTYELSDGTSTDQGLVSLSVTKCIVSGLTASQSSVTRQDSDVTKLGESVTFTASSTGPCSGRLTLEYISDLSSGTVSPSVLIFSPSGTASFSAGHGDWIKPTGQPTHPDYTWTLNGFLDGTTPIGSVSLTVKGKK